MFTGLSVHMAHSLKSCCKNYHMRASYSMSIRDKNSGYNLYIFPINLTSFFLLPLCILAISLLRKGNKVSTQMYFIYTKVNWMASFRHGL